MALRSVHDTLFNQQEVQKVRKGQRGYKNVQQPDQLDQMEVYGFACTLIDDDDQAAAFGTEQALFAWQGQADLKMDRYDVRHLLDNLNFKRHTPFVPDIEEVELDKERYRDLDFHQDSESGDDETADTRKAGQYGSVPFAYPDAEHASVALSTEAKEEVEVVKAVLPSFQPSFQIPEGLEAHLPPTQKLHQIIAHTAKFICEHGGQAEIVLRVKQAGNANFDFLLPDHNLHPYFRFLVAHPGVLSSAASREGERAGSEQPGNAVSLLGHQYGDEEEEEQEGSGEGADAVAGACDEKEVGLLGEDIVEAERREGGEAELIKKSAKENSNDIEGETNEVPEGKEGLLEGMSTRNDLGIGGEDKPALLKEETIVEPPPQMQKIILKMVEFIVRNGKEFEAIVTERDKADGRFLFLLPSNEHHLFYKRELGAAFQALERSLQPGDGAAEAPTAEKGGDSRVEESLKAPAAGNSQSNAEGCSAEAVTEQETQPTESLELLTAPDVQIDDASKHMSSEGGSEKETTAILAVAEPPARKVGGSEANRGPQASASVSVSALAGKPPTVPRVRSNPAFFQPSDTHKKERSVSPSQLALCPDSVLTAAGKQMPSHPVSSASSDPLREVAVADGEKPRGKGRELVGQSKKGAGGRRAGAGSVSSRDAGDGADAGPEGGQGEAAATGEHVEDRAGAAGAGPQADAREEEEEEVVGHSIDAVAAALQAARQRTHPPRSPFSAAAGTRPAGSNEPGAAQLGTTVPAQQPHGEEREKPPSAELSSDAIASILRRVTGRGGTASGTTPDLACGPGRTISPCGSGQVGTSGRALSGQAHSGQPGSRLDQSRLSGPDARASAGGSAGVPLGLHKTHEELVAVASRAAQLAAAAAAGEADSADAKLSAPEKRKLERLKKAKLFAAFLKGGAAERAASVTSVPEAAATSLGLSSRSDRGRKSAAAAGTSDCKPRMEITGSAAAGLSTDSGALGLGLPSQDGMQGLPAGSSEGHKLMHEGLVAGGNEEDTGQGCEAGHLEDTEKAGLDGSNDGRADNAAQRHSAERGDRIRDDVEGGETGGLEVGEESDRWGSGHVFNEGMAESRGERGKMKSSEQEPRKHGQRREEGSRSKRSHKGRVSRGADQRVEKVDRETAESAESEELVRGDKEAARGRHHHRRHRASSSPRKHGRKRHRKRSGVEESEQEGERRRRRHRRRHAVEDDERKDESEEEGEGRQVQGASSREESPLHSSKNGGKDRSSRGREEETQRRNKEGARGVDGELDRDEESHRRRKEVVEEEEGSPDEKRRKHRRSSKRRRKSDVDEERGGEGKRNEKHQLSSSEQEMSDDEHERRRKAKKSKSGHRHAGSKRRDASALERAQEDIAYVLEKCTTLELDSVDPVPVAPAIDVPDDIRAKVQAMLAGMM